MERDSEEYKRFKKEYEAKQNYRREHPEEYPYFSYHQYGYHRMSFLTKEEAEDEVKFYHLKSDYKGGWFRLGRQPITITPRR